MEETSIVRALLATTEQYQTPNYSHWTHPTVARFIRNVCAKKLS